VDQDDMVYLSIHLFWIRQHGP